MLMRSIQKHEADTMCKHTTVHKNEKEHVCSTLTLEGPPGEACMSPLYERTPPLSFLSLLHL